MLHIYDQRFDVTENLKIFCELNKALFFPTIRRRRIYSEV